MVHSDRYPRFLVCVAFLVTFLGVRGVTHAVRRRQSFLARALHRGGGIQIGSVHVHHLVGGIVLLLLTGYLSTTVERPRSRDRLALLYGIGAALTLDEFALWLRLKDVYWARQGRASVDAGVAAGAAFVLAGLGRPFLQALLRDVRRPLAR
uniref:Uncharacterized protein n=1 Tax=uncultured Armatimonadetes bacterium TaxID=157466 RepID=A0A6J4H685_9BACT|nr:hypothetical protein AVDCRST_MAG63-33 [uncultured Armatimonadetes bacterium]